MVSPIKVYAPWDMTSDNAIVNLHDPTNQQDAATKSYVDMAIWALAFDASAPDPYGDLCVSPSLDPRWTLNGSMAVVADGSKYAVTGVTQADRMTQAFVDTGQDFEMAAHIENYADHREMFGLLATDSAGNGIGLSPFDGTMALWPLTSWGLDSGWQSGMVTQPSLADYWTSLRRVGGTTWYARSVSGSGAWVPLTGPDVLSSGHTRSGHTFGPITRIGLGQMYPNAGITAEIHSFVTGSPIILARDVDAAGAAASQRTFQFFGG